MRTAPDVCVVDLYMPGGGVAAIQELHRLLPYTPIVVLTVSTSDADMFDSLAAGATGFVPKETPADRLPDVLRGGSRSSGAEASGAPGLPPTAAAPSATR